MIEHSTISDPYLHEPKGAASALAGSVYVADGLGSGVWQPVPVTSLAGVLGAGADGQVLVSDGTSGFRLKTLQAVGSMGFSNNAANRTVTEATDASFATASDYDILSGVGVPYVAGALSDVTFNSNRLIAQVDGIYRISGFVNTANYSDITAKFAIRVAVNGSVLSRFVEAHPQSGQAVAVPFEEYVSLVAGDFVQLAIAASYSGTILIKNMNLTIDLRKAA